MAAADTGPKPTPTIQVTHPPEDLYCLGLLVPAEKAGDYDNLVGGEL